jgi:methyl-accepting chemotaxis protein WspA
MLNQLSIRSKLIVVRIIYLLVIGVFAATSYHVVTNLSALLNEQTGVSTLLRSALLMDMRHDNTRSLMLTALKTSETNQLNPEEAIKLTEEFKQNKQLIMRYISDLEKANLSERTRKALEVVKPGFETFLDLAEKIIDQAHTDRNIAQTKFPLFMENFRSLEKTQVELFDAIEEQINNINKRGTDTSEAALRIIVISTLIGTLFIFTASILIVRTIVNRTEAAYGYLKEMAEGNLNVDVRMDIHDEITKILMGVSRLRNKLVSDLEKSKHTAEDLKTLVKQIQGSAVHVNSSINELSATSREQESMVSEVAATVTQVSTSSKEIASTTRELLRTMNEAAAITETSGALAASGQQDLVKMGDTMRSVMEASASINTRLAMLNEKAGNISQVTTTIAKVADQTNLLSLNAAIEAEKAGEYGRGFAIVATEIRRLADQTAVASYDIELIVKEMQSAVSASVMGMDKFSEETRRGLQDIQQIGLQLSQVIEQVQILIPKFEIVNQGMSSQTDASEQISQGLTQVNDAMHQIVDTVRQSTTSVQDIAGTSNSLSAAVAHFNMGS